MKKEKKLTKKELKRLEKKLQNKKDKEWRLQVKERDKSQCVLCKETKMVNVHHIIPRQVKEFRWNIDNGICLCPSHHKYSNQISAHKNPMIFYNWMNFRRGKQIEKLLNEYTLYTKRLSKEKWDS